ncbi:MAG: biopolymer transporter ExbD [Verrucomicrobia bacterium]|nr:biopolymer transporter ExbD [Verrucomicrobiota bacterium]MCH8511476.1 biopolymer transporter ExbD [Kiritimatiellia bacterium]
MIRRETDEDPHVQMEPLIDMVFLLLIFFLVTASLKKPHKELAIEMPQAIEAKDANHAEELVITVTREGERYVDDGAMHRNQAPVSRHELIQVLASVSRERPDLPVRLDVDRRVQYYHLMDMVDTLELYGMRNVHLRSAHGVHDELQ